MEKAQVRFVAAILAAVLVSLVAGLVIGERQDNHTTAAGPWRMHAINIIQGSSDMESAFQDVNDFLATLDPACEVQGTVAGTGTAILTYRC